MTLIPSSEVRERMVVVGSDGDLYHVLSRTPKKLRLGNVRTGLVHEQMAAPDESIETVELEKRTLLYLYPKRGKFVFLGQETYDEIPLPRELVGDSVRYLREADEVTVTYHNGQPILLELPDEVELQVVETEPKSASSQTKSAVLETGAKVQVPSTIDIGDVVRIDPRSDGYRGRVRDAG